MKILKASVANVQIGTFSIEGLMDENGDFAVAVPQIADHFQFDKGQASRKLKALMRKGFQFDKLQTEINPKAVNVMRLQDFSAAIFELHERGNKLATHVVKSLWGMSLHQLFCDAFEIKFESEDRQRWLVERMTSRVDFRPLTDQLKRHGFSEPKQYARYVWAFQTKAGIPSGCRDIVDAVALSKLNTTQAKLTALMEYGVSPWDALKRI